MSQQRDPEWWKIEEAKASFLNSLILKIVPCYARGNLSFYQKTLVDHFSNCEQCDSSVEQAVLEIWRLLDSSG